MSIEKDLFDALAKKLAGDNCSLVVCVTSKDSQESFIHAFNMEGVHRETVALAITEHVCSQNN